jgi:hypothetical protein
MGLQALGLMHGGAGGHAGVAPDTVLGLRDDEAVHFRTSEHAYGRIANLKIDK